ncbi:hypothetical protein [uncultured Bacteroides sp.]|uniref:hypothetical protein n=1 Tax=uncultured Bacteroides sp. TaxID=162156 RepID=UPI002AAB7DC9|nr:hypothetical protein [uncultured Bacteroides sp.]
MKYEVKRILLLLLFFVPFILSAQDSVKVNNVTMNGYVKDMQSFVFKDFKSAWTNSNLIHNRLNFKWFISPSFTASLEFRNRFLYGNILNRFPGYNNMFDYDNGITRLSTNWFQGKNYIFNTSVDRLWLQYSSNKLQIIAGRQRINWGQNYVWNPNDIFNTYSYFDFDYEEKPGSDAVRMQYYPTSTSVVEFAAKINKQKKTTLAGLYRFNQWKYDIQFIAAMVNQSDLMIGTGWSGQLGKGGFAGEASYFRPMSHFIDSTGVFLASAGYNYTFKNSLFLQVEALYNGNKNSANIFSIDQLTSSNLSARNLFLPDFSLFCSASYPIIPLVNCSLAGIGNSKSKLYIIIPTLNISLSNNLELSFIGQILRYTEKSIFSQDLNFVYVRLKQSF